MCVILTVIIKVALSAVYVILAGTYFVSGCDEGKPCQLSNGEAGLCLGLVCHSQISEETRVNLSFAITVRYPERRIRVSDGAKIMLDVQLILKIFCLGRVNLYNII